MTLTSSQRDGHARFLFLGDRAGRLFPADCLPPDAICSEMDSFSGLVAEAARARPDLILLADGPDTLEWVTGIRRLTSLSGVPVLVLAESERDHQAAYLDAGADDVCTASGGLALLAARLNRHLMRRQQQVATQGTADSPDISAMARILDHLPLPVLVVDTAGRCTYFNAASEQAFGIRAADYIGRTDLWRMFYQAPTDLLAQQIAKGQFSRDASIYRDELSMLAGQEVYVLEHYFPLIGRHLSVTASPLRDEQGLLIGAIETVSDVTGLKQREDEALSLQRKAQAATETKSRFLANMSHEIRTPMNAIIGMVELCQRTHLKERQRHYLSKIRLASESLLHIINEILDFSKIEAGRLELEEAPFVLESVFEQLSAVVALRAEQQGIELNYDIQDDSRVLGGDAMRLGQVLTNLLSNAIKFSAGGRVLVKVQDGEVTPEMVELHFSVQDNGIGIAPEEQDRLFQPFSQADASTTRKYGGTGLGLAISSFLVQRMGGKIWVESELGKGSTFHFTARFRHIRKDRRSGIAALAAKLAAHAEQPVLVVDDSLTAREILSRILGHLGLQTLTAATGEEALQMVARHKGPPFLAAFIDWKMPGMSGLELIDRLRDALARDGGKVPPMILVSAYSHHEELRDLVGRIDSLLGKPISARQLYVELANCLGLSDPVDQRRDRRGGGNQNWAPFRHLDVLVVEDIEVNREVIGELLMSVGIKPRFAEDGVQAIDAVTRKRPDVVLMDCQMPVMDGYEATRRLRSTPDGECLPIIALTANASFEDKARCHFVGMNGHIAKPVRLDDVYSQFLVHFPPQGNPVPADAAEAGRPPPLTAETLDLPGVEVALGLSQTGGKLPLYLRVLKKYRETQVRNFEQEFRDAVAKSERMTQIRLAHSLKGVSLMLGVMETGEAAAALERALRDDHADLAERIFTRLIAELGRVGQGLLQLDLHVPDE